MSSAEPETPRSLARRPPRAPLERDTLQTWPGKPYPLGATYDGTGVNFALFSEVAEEVELCLIDDAGAETRITLPEVDGFVWHAKHFNLTPPKAEKKKKK